MKTYQWQSAELKTKAKRFNTMMLMFMVTSLICLFALPESAKVWNMLPLGIAIVFWVLGWRVQSQDRKISKPKE
jgi:hypothetical protein